MTTTTEPNESITDALLMRLGVQRDDLSKTKAQMKETATALRKRPLMAARIIVREALVEIIRGT
jgi:hypothetical protein